MCTNQVDWQHSHHIVLSFLPFLWVQLNFTQLQNIQQVCIGHCTARRPSIHVSRNCRARLRVKGEWYHKGRSGVITTDNSNQLNNKNAIVWSITILCESRMCSTCLINFIAMLPGYCFYMTLRSKVALFSTFVTGLTRRKTFPSFIRMFGATKLVFSFLGLLRPLRFALLLPPFSFLFSFAEWWFPAAWTVFGDSVSALCESWIAHWRKELTYTQLTLAHGVRLEVGDHVCKCPEYQWPICLEVGSHRDSQIHLTQQAGAVSLYTDQCFHFRRH